MKKELAMELLEMIFRQDSSTSESPAPSGSTNSIYSRNIGKYVIVRSYNEGLNAGILVEADDTGCVLKDARRIWYHRPSDSDQAWYEGVANSGLSSDSKISPSVSEKVIVEKYSITLCSDISEASIKGAPSAKS